MKTFLFDLDGTLLPMNQDNFIKVYFGELVKRFSTLGFDGKALVQAVWKATESMIKNDGSTTNEERFWSSFASILGPDILEHKNEFEDFYRNEFAAASSQTWKNDLADKSIKLLKSKGYRVIAATNPIFPQIATYTRMNWAGLDINDFELITTYDNSTFCKPSLNYYKEIMNKVSCIPTDCIMVGNDVREDMCASELGMKTFLIKDCMINMDNRPIESDYQGSFEDFYNYIKELDPATIE